MVNMGLGFGLGSGTACFKRKFRWLFKVPGVSDDSESSGVNALPPEKAARPSLSFKEIQVEHLNETIYYPSKPDWKPVNLVLYDLKKNQNSVVNWINNLYRVSQDNVSWNMNMSQFKKTSRLEMYDGCGNVIETWVFENSWPNNIEWGELDMSDSGYVTIDLTLRYDRAYIIN